jgi:hypothetical protein
MTFSLVLKNIQAQARSKTTIVGNEMSTLTPGICEKQKKIAYNFIVYFRVYAHKDVHNGIYLVLQFFKDIITSQII